MFVTNQALRVETANPLYFSATLQGHRFCYLKFKNLAPP